MKSAQFGALIAAMVAGAPAAAQDESQPAPPDDGRIVLRSAADGEALMELVQILTVEAKGAADKGQFPRSKADVAQHVARRFDSRLVSKFMLRQAGREPLIDAYVRWQLTSFDPVVPSMELRSFQGFLERLPALEPNPRADETRIAALQTARGAGPLSADDAKRIGEFLDAMTSRTSRATNLNQPALELRQWVIDGAEDRPAHRLMARLEQIEELLGGGWDVREAKQQLELELANAAVDQEFSRADRKAVADAIGRLAGRSRLVLESAQIVDNTLVASFFESAVYEFDATRWQKMLLDE